MDHIKLWEGVKNEIELVLSKHEFVWFKDININHIEEGVVRLSVPNTFVKEWIWKRFHNNILKILRTNNEAIRGLDYVIIQNKEKNEEGTPKPKQIVCNELPLDEYYINKEDNLNSRYTFDNFVIGPFNEIAHTAAQAIIKNPGKNYNPLFIYGNTGLGKTHLIQAIGNTIKKNFPNKKVFYLTSEKFGTECLECLQNNKMGYFKEKYRKYDTVIVDDIQFFSGKEKFQEELFHLFNYLYDNYRQIIFSSDKHPNYIPNLEDRLKSRFSSGMIVDIPNPDNQSRAVILKAKSRYYNLVLEDDIVNYLAENINGNIRELEGVLNTIVVQTQMKNKSLNLSDIKNLIKDATRIKKNVSVKDIIKVVSQFYSIEEDSIYEKTRRKEVVKPRQIIMYILREDFNISYPSIGDKLGGRDHTTVIHSCEKIKKDLKIDQSLVQEINQIRSMI
ncbi:MAG: chromosomal replication initiator protein DnaA [bacterium]|nr:chromosomal replication initiator protein DnaA [bacterium]